MEAWQIPPMPGDTSATPSPVPEETERRPGAYVSCVEPHTTSVATCLRFRGGHFSNKPRNVEEKDGCVRGFPNPVLQPRARQQLTSAGKRTGFRPPDVPACSRRSGSPQFRRIARHNPRLKIRSWQKLARLCRGGKAPDTADLSGCRSPYTPGSPYRLLHRRQERLRPFSRQTALRSSAPPIWADRRRRRTWMKIIISSTNMYPAPAETAVAG